MFGFVDVAIIWGLGFGVYKKSRMCAMIILSYYLINRYVIYLHVINVDADIVITILMAALLFLGIIGTFAAHPLGQNG